MNIDSTNEPELFVKLRPDVSVEHSEGGRFLLSRPQHRGLVLPQLPLLEKLRATWLSEAELESLAADSPDLTTAYFVIVKVFSAGFVQAQWRQEGSPLFTIEPAPDFSAWRRKGAGTLPRRLSPYACLRRTGEDFLLEMPLSTRRCFIHAPRCMAWLFLPPEQTDVSSAPFYTALDLMGALAVDGDEPSSWEFHDLLFFHHTSGTFHDQPQGATWRLKGMIPPAPLFKPCTGETLPLPARTDEARAKLQAPFCGVLASRRSQHAPGECPLTLEAVSALLDASARVQSVLDDSTYPCPASLRPSPSGGALHSIEIYLAPRQCRGLPLGVWRYLPERHELERIPVGEDALAAYLQIHPHAHIPHAQLPHLQLIMTSRFLRTSWKYERVAYRLALQDLGCLYQTLSLTATALGLASCILGAVDVRRIGGLLRLETLTEPVIGAMTLSAA